MKKIPQLSDAPRDDLSPEREPAAREPVAPMPVGSASESSDEPDARDDDVPASRALAPDALGETVSDAGEAASALDTVRQASGGDRGRGAGEPRGERSGGEAGRERDHGAGQGRGKGSGQSSGRSGGKGSRSRARRYARERALQALYQWDLARAESSDVKRQFLDRQDMSRVDVDYFERLFRGVSHDVDKVDAALGEALDRPIAELDPIERAVLRVAAFELAEVPETPARVAINEGVEITKRFGADNGHRYVNGVLDRLAGLLRPLEMRRG